jgi:hypothetical protein
MRAAVLCVVPVLLMAAAVREAAACVASQIPLDDAAPACLIHSLLLPPLQLLSPLLCSRPRC